MTLDIGAQGTALSVRYFEKFKNDVGKWKETDEEVGGAGGTNRHKVYEEPSLEMSLGQSILLKDISITSKKTNAGLDELYGNLGQDFFMSFDHVTFNFSTMTFGFGKAPSLNKSH